MKNYFCCIKKLFCVLLLAALTNSAWPLTIYDIPSVVSSNSIELKKKMIEVDVKRVDVDNHFFEYMPDLNLTYDGGFGYLLRPDDYAGSHVFALTSKWDFTNADRIFKHGREQIEYNNSKLEYTELYQEELYQTIVLFVKVLEERISLEIAKSNESISKLQYGYVYSRKKQGAISELELLNAKAEYDDTIYLAKLSEINYEQALSLLKQKLQSKELKVFDIDIKIFKRLDFKSLHEKYLIDNSLTDLKRMENDISILKLHKAVAIRDRWVPSVALTLGMDWLKYSYLSSGEEWTDKNMYDYVGLAVNVPIYEKNINFNKIRKLDLQLKKSRINASDYKRRKIQDIREKVKNHNNKIGLIDVSLKRLKSAEINYKRMSDSYKLGITSLIDLYQAKKRFREAKRDLKFLKYDIVLIKIKIGKSLGDAMIFVRKVK